MLRRLFSGLFVAALLTACDSGDPNGTSRMTVLLTDAEGDVTQAVVTVERIELVGGAGGVQVLSETAWTGDLTDLTNDFVTLVSDAVIPVGTYSQLRVIVSEACLGVETADGPDDVFTSPDATVVCEGNPAGELQLPSYAQTGIKVVFQGPIEVTSDQKIVLIDFDVAQSFGREAGSSRWVMDPTILGVDITFSATVNLTVELANGVEVPTPPGLEGFTASLSGENQALAPDGTASWLFVLPGDYQVSLTAPAGFAFNSTPTVPVDITVLPGETEEVTITLDSFDPVP